MRRMLLAAALLAGACAPASAAERGFAVAGFEQVRVAGSLDVRIYVGGPVSVRASGPQAALDRLEIVSEGGQLTIRTDPRDGSDWSRQAGGRVVVSVSVPALNAVALDGSGNISIDRIRARSFAASLAGSGGITLAALQAESATFDVSGSGSITATGEVGAARTSLIGSGDIRGGGLRAGSATIALSGSGGTTLAAQRSATVSLDGSGNVTITGPARCTTTRHGSGEVRCGG